MDRITIPKLLLLALPLILFTACKTTKTITTETASQAPVYHAIFDSMKLKEVNFETLSANFSAEANINNKITNINGQIRLIKDSIIWVTLTPALGIEVFRLLVTPDSIRYLNRLNNTYLIESIRYLNSLAQTDIDFYMLQSLLLGNDFSNFAGQQLTPFSLRTDNNQFVLHTDNRNKLTNTIPNSQFSISQSIWLNKQNYRIVKQQIKQQGKESKLDIVYNNFQNIDEQMIPHTLDFNIFDNNKQSQIKISYNKVTLNPKVNIPFSIPSKYTNALKNE